MPAARLKISPALEVEVGNVVLAKQIDQQNKVIDSWAMVVGPQDGEPIGLLYIQDHNIVQQAFLQGYKGLVLDTGLKLQVVARLNSLSMIDNLPDTRQDYEKLLVVGDRPRFYAPQIAKGVTDVTGYVFISIDGIIERFDDVEEKNERHHAAIAGWSWTVSDKAKVVFEDSDRLINRITD